MKQTILIAALAVVLIGCTHQPTRYSATQSRTATDDLIEFFDSYWDKSCTVGNELQKSELFDQQQRDLMKLMDSVAIFQGLSGKISNIRKIKETKNTVLVSYDIDVENKSNSIVSLSLTCYNTFKDKKNDSLYMSIVSIPDNSTVYFDGVFAVDDETNLPEYRNFGYYLSFSSQDYVFNVVNISKEKTDTLSPALIDALRAARQSVMYIRQNPDKARSTISNNYKKEFDKAEAKLTDKEKAYLKRYMVAVMN